MYLDDSISRSSAPAGDFNYGADPAAKGEYRETIIRHCWKTIQMEQDDRAKHIITVE